MKPTNIPVWINFLHIYQPLNQKPLVLQAVVNESYRPIVEILKRNPSAKIVLNINAVLSELLIEHGYEDLVKSITELVQGEQIELTDSAKYHVILPLLSDSDIKRQIEVNYETNRKIFGSSYSPKGFFPPEMAFDNRIAKILHELGYEWVLADELTTYKVPSAKQKGIPMTQEGLYVFTRDRHMSNTIMSGVTRNARDYLQLSKHVQKPYFVTGMDGETFGHHRPGLEKTLEQLLGSKGVTTQTPSSYLLGQKGKIKSFKFVPELCSWASSQKDVENGIPLLTWDDPENEIHKMQHKFINKITELVHSVSDNDKNYPEIMNKYDVALASDQYFWASAKPWWSIEMIESELAKALEILPLLPNLSKKDESFLNNLYSRILRTSYEWQRTGVIEKWNNQGGEDTRIPFKDRTVGKGGAEEGVYHAFIKMMRDEEIKAAKAGEYEKAILWRDAIWKLETKNDIYDTIHVVDLLRKEIPYEEVEKTIQKYKGEYEKIRGGQPEQRGA